MYKASRGSCITTSVTHHTNRVVMVNKQIFGKQLELYGRSTTSEHGNAGAEFTRRVCVEREYCAGCSSLPFMVENLMKSLPRTPQRNVIHTVSERVWIIYRVEQLLVIARPSVANRRSCLVSWICFIIV